VQADAATWAWMSWHSSNHRRLDHLTTGEEMIVTDRIPALNA
jgi:hypothetical protein